MSRTLELSDRDIEQLRSIRAGSRHVSVGDLAEDLLARLQPQEKDYQSGAAGLAVDDWVRYSPTADFGDNPNPFHIIAIRDDMMLLEEWDLGYAGFRDDPYGWVRGCVQRCDPPDEYDTRYDINRPATSLDWLIHAPLFAAALYAQHRDLIEEQETGGWDSQDWSRQAAWIVAVDRALRECGLGLGRVSGFQDPTGNEQ